MAVQEDDTLRYYPPDGKDWGKVTLSKDDNGEELSVKYFDIRAPSEHSIDNNACSLEI